MRPEAALVCADPKNCCLEAGSWKLEAGSWKLEGTLKLEDER